MCAATYCCKTGSNQPPAATRLAVTTCCCKTDSDYAILSLVKPQLDPPASQTAAESQWLPSSVPPASSCSCCWPGRWGSQQSPAADAAVPKTTPHIIQSKQSAKRFQQSPKANAAALKAAPNHLQGHSARHTTRQKATEQAGHLVTP
jgi:hypothetical protein